MSARVYMHHIRQAGFCRDGFFYWCKIHGIDHREIAHGYPIDKLRSIDCDSARKVIEIVEMDK